MGHAHGLSPVEQRKADIGVGVKGFIILLIITFLEVAVALVGNGHIMDGVTFPKMLMIPLMIGLSLYKAYYIVGTFMHLGHETRGMAASVVLPMMLLVWGIIAFLWEGEAWRQARHDLDKHSKPATTAPSGDETSSIIKPIDQISNKIWLS
ncbi:MAG: cytochrome C oxidase subunit IV family protein [Aureispira sp.]|nr:cytochrome C oxidase subunit IV family protein [Aureispira sp.]